MSECVISSATRSRHSRLVLGLMPMRSWQTSQTIPTRPRSSRSVKSSWATDWRRGTRSETSKELTLFSYASLSRAVEVEACADAQRSSGRATAEQLPVAALGHPLGPREMAFKRSPGAIEFTFRVEMQYYSCNITPIGTVRFSVEQPQVRDKVLMVVGGQYGTGGRDVGDIGIERGFLHGAVSQQAVDRQLSALGSWQVDDASNGEMTCAEEDRQAKDDQRRCRAGQAPIQSGASEVVSHRNLLRPLGGIIGLRRDGSSRRQRFQFRPSVLTWCRRFLMAPPASLESAPDRRCDKIVTVIAKRRALQRT
jgi:hypothetical protein